MKMKNSSVTIWNRTRDLPPPENRAVYEIMWRNIVQPDRPKMTVWRMRNACWIPKANDTHSEYVILIAFPQQQWSRERECYVLRIL
jgi:hypothetical protein